MEMCVRCECGVGGEIRMQDNTRRRVSRRWVEEYAHKCILCTEYCTYSTYVGQSCVPALITRSTLLGAPTVCSWFLDAWTRETCSKPLHL